ncbi:MAG: hypothetical protein MPK07_01105 [Alphaproteobacteria bacterium]|nr:hypothetical protein [Alphaproteobacteria bacterium]MDA8012517.1 hypothetical protein [Alphaproteobacteria bacterium]
MSKSALIATIFSPLARKSARRPPLEDWEKNPEPGENWVTQEDQRREVDANIKVFREELLDDLLAQGHERKFALMRGGKVVKIMDDFHEAVLEGKRRFYPYEPFSVQKITDKPENLGTLAAWVAPRST